MAGPDFTKSLDQMSATVYVSEVEHERHIAGRAIPLNAGSTTLTWVDAKRIIRAIDTCMADGYPKRLRKRMRAIRNSLIFAFGPEAEREVSPTSY